MRRAGHAGTLDPFATGLLVLLIGRATRLLPYLEGEPKEYDAAIRFGAETDTDDATGTVVRIAETPPPAAVDRAMASLTGTVEQVPPAYSAKKIGGRRAYAAARRGEMLDLKPSLVTVHAWSVREHQPDLLRASIVCSGGTYVRALARDLGRLAGSAAHLVALRRTRSGSFRVADALPLDHVGAAEGQVRSPLEAVPSLPMTRLEGAELARVARGESVPASGDTPLAALVDTSGTLVAIAERVGNRWQPRVVMRDA